VPLDWIVIEPNSLPIADTFSHCQNRSDREQGAIVEREQGASVTKALQARALDKVNCC